MSLFPMRKKILWAAMIRDSMMCHTNMYCSIAQCIRKPHRTTYELLDAADSIQELVFYDNEVYTDILFINIVMIVYTSHKYHKYIELYAGRK